MGVLGHGAHIDRHTGDKASQCQDPKQKSKGVGESLLQARGLVFEMEVDEDGNGDDGKVDG
jgi:hypothetical protein